MPPLYLEGVHLVCLCGPNGHGKSALLDAITWAVWGKARGGEIRSQEELIHQGQQDMMVELEFKSKGTTYRITRRHARSRSGAGHTSLELQIASPDGFQPITGNTIRETEWKIQENLGMDYDTFINSMFLLQGRADEFTAKTPSQRKQVLAKVLRLASFDKLEDKAKGRARELEGLERNIMGRLEGTAADMDRKTEYQATLSNVIETLAQADHDLYTHTNDDDGLRNQIESLSQRQLKVTELEARAVQIKEEVENLHSRISRLVNRINEYEMLILQKTDVIANTKLLEDLQHQEEKLSQAQARIAHIQQIKLPMEKTLAEARERLVSQISHLYQSIERELQPKVASVATLDVELIALDTHLGILEQEEVELEELRGQLDTFSEQIQSLKSQTTLIESEGRDLRASLDLLQHKGESAQCPVCGQALGQADHHRLLDLYENQRKEKLQSFRDNETDLTRLQEQRQPLENEIHSKDNRLRLDLREGHSQKARLEQKLEIGRKAMTELEWTNSDLIITEELLNNEEYAQSEREQLKLLHQETERLSYDVDYHNDIRSRIAELHRYLNLAPKVLQAEVELPKDRQELLVDQKLAKVKQDEISQILADLVLTKQDLMILSALKDDLQRSQGVGQGLQYRRDQLLSQKGDLEGKLERIRALTEEAASQEKELKRLREEHGLFSELALALGKGGVQALLIETAIPLLENEANELLSRMTDSRMSIKLETQRERTASSGAPEETLEIKVADELGTRSYETFSGGEAFRINFSLRIALSKLMARRSGAPLSTLFIDEGFGTQDTQGREKILDVIRAIEKDFEKIFVITHLEEVKEAFPVRIEIQKTESGSTFWLS